MVPLCGVRRVPVLAHMARWSGCGLRSARAGRPIADAGVGVSWRRRSAWNVLIPHPPGVCMLRLRLVRAVVMFIAGTALFATGAEHPRRIPAAGGHHRTDGGLLHG